MPSARVLQVINNMTERQYREAQENFRNYHSQADFMNFQDFIETPEFEEELQGAYMTFRADGQQVVLPHSGPNTRETDGGSRGLGGSDGVESGVRGPREYHSHHASDFSGHFVGRRGIGKRDYDEYSNGDSMAEDLGSLYAEGGRGRPCARIQSGASDPQGSGLRHSGYSTGGSVDFHGRHHRHGAPQSPRLGSHSDTSSHYASQQETHSQGRCGRYGGSSHSRSAASESYHGRLRNPAGNTHS